MTAAELNKIVEDVPREAWPEGEEEWGSYTVAFEHGQWNLKNAIGQNVQAIMPFQIVLMFIGSMTLHLHHTEPYVNITPRNYSGTMVSCWFGEIVGDTLIEALAKACKAQKGAKDG